MSMVDVFADLLKVQTLSHSGLVYLHFMMSPVRLLPVDFAVDYMTLFKSHIKAGPDICFVRSIPSVHHTRQR